MTLPDANLAAAERTDIARKPGEYWTTDTGAANIRSLVVGLRLQVDTGGIVRSVQSRGPPPVEPRAQAVYEATRRVLLASRCNPLPLPHDRLAALGNSIFRFSPQELGLP